MARDALKKQAEKMNIKIKVETNGSSGIKNHLTEQDIERATGIIVAADVHVETDRFDGKMWLRFLLLMVLNALKN